jgi:hypothetical protein
MLTSELYESPLYSRVRDGNFPEHRISSSTAANAGPIYPAVPTLGLKYQRDCAIYFLPNSTTLAPAARPRVGRWRSLTEEDGKTQGGQNQNAAT